MSHTLQEKLELKRDIRETQLENEDEATVLTVFQCLAAQNPER